MKDSKQLSRHAFILDVLCLLLCFALLYMGNKHILSTWMLAVGAVIALAALVASVVLMITARKIDRAEERRIEREILTNAATPADGDDKSQPANEDKQ